MVASSSCPASLNSPQLAAALRTGADLVVTDSNRRRARRWDTLRDDVGYTERAGQPSLVADPEDHRLDIASNVTDADRTVVEQRGARVDATAYGDATFYVPEDRPALAFDGNTQTAWRAGGSEDQVNARLIVRPDHPVHADHVTLVQPLNGARDRSIARVRISFDHGPSVDATLDAHSQTAAGQVIHFSPRKVHQLSIEVLGTTAGPATPVGFAEVGLGHVHVDEITRIPVDLLRRAGAASLRHRLVIALSRLRANPGVPGRQDPELAMTRQFALPTNRTFTVAVTERPNPNVPTDAGNRAGSCRSDLITVDGTSLPVQSSPAHEAANGAAVYRSCAPITLDAGSHIVRTRPGLDTGIDVDRLVLTSAAGGEAAVNAVAHIGSQSRRAERKCASSMQGRRASTCMRRPTGSPSSSCSVKASTTAGTRSSPTARRSAPPVSSTDSRTAGSSPRSTPER